MKTFLSIFAHELSKYYAHFSVVAEHQTFAGEPKGETKR